MSDMSAGSDEALQVLREIWHSSGQTLADVDSEVGEAKSCKRMTDAGVGFDDFAAGGEDLRAAWRERLAREGKLSSEGSLRDLVMKPTASR
jgi:hypothetical protein